MMVRHIQQTVQNLIGPNVGGVLAAGGTKPALAGMRNYLHVSATLINMTAQNRSSAGKHLSHVLKNNRTDPFLVASNKLRPMCCENASQVVTNSRNKPKHPSSPF
jgi:hypothetical protein